MEVDAARCDTGSCVEVEFRCESSNCVEVDRRCGMGECVEVENCGHGVRVRDSKDPEGPVLTFTNGEWAAFIAGARNGEFGG